MRNRTRCLFGMLICLMTTPTVLAQWSAGVAKAVITPEKPMWMAGYASRDHPAEGKLTELWAKVLVLDDGDGERAALITLDLIGIDRALAASICDQIHQAHGLDRKQIAICWGFLEVCNE